MAILQLYTDKWQTTKTLIKNEPNGFKVPYYIDKYGKCVMYYPLIDPNKFVVIGEVEYTTEEINFDKMA